MSWNFSCPRGLLFAFGTELQTARSNSQNLHRSPSQAWFLRTGSGCSYSWIENMPNAQFGPRMVLPPVETWNCTSLWIEFLGHRVGLASQVELVVKNPPANAGVIRGSGSIPGWGRSPGGGYGNPLQYSCLENPMARGAWQATIRRATQSCTWLKWHSTDTHRVGSALSLVIMAHLVI